MAIQRALATELAEWLETPLGQYVRAWEQAHVDAMVGNAFGYHAIQIGLPQWDLLQANRIAHKVRAHGPDVAQEGVLNHLVCAPEQLPFPADSVDLLVLPHALEYCADPHQVLREVDRVLIPEGRVVITGFNPLSLWGARESLPGLGPQLPVPVSAQVSLGRLKDWFKLLSFEPDRGHFGCYVPLCQTPQWLQRWSFMEAAGDRWWPAAGAVYAISAVKRVVYLRMQGPVKRRKARRMRARRAAVATAANRIKSQ